MCYENKWNQKYFFWIAAEEEHNLQSIKLAPFKNHRVRAWGFCMTFKKYRVSFVWLMVAILLPFFSSTSHESLYWIHDEISEPLNYFKTHQTKLSDHQQQQQWSLALHVFIFIWQNGNCHVFLLSLYLVLSICFIAQSHQMYIIMRLFFGESYKFY